VAQGLVVGIFPSSDPAAIHNALSGQQIDTSKVKVVSRGTDQAVAIPEDSDIEFLDVEQAMEQLASYSDDMTREKGIMEDSGGTSVPGIGGRGPSLSSFTHAEYRTYLSGLKIPDDEVDNFNGAIEEGRAVVAYPDAGDNAGVVAAAFKAAGLRNVRTY
jgi:hypothetical protein